MPMDIPMPRNGERLTAGSVRRPRPWPRGTWFALTVPTMPFVFAPVGWVASAAGRDLPVRERAVFHDGWDGMP
jgi:hypothetical protein